MPLVAMRIPRISRAGGTFANNGRADERHQDNIEPGEKAGIARCGVLQSDRLQNVTEPKEQTGNRAGA